MNVAGPTTKINAARLTGPNSEHLRIETRRKTHREDATENSLALLKYLENSPQETDRNGSECMNKLCASPHTQTQNR